MKNSLLILVIGIIYFGCSSDEPGTSNQCFDGLEIIQNNPNSKVFTDEDGFLVIQINDPQATDDVVLRYSTLDGFIAGRNHYLFTLATISDFETEEDTDKPPTAYAIFNHIAYDFDIDNPIISIKAGGDNSNIIFPGFTGGATNLAGNNAVTMKLILEGDPADVTAGSFNAPFTWDGFELPDPIVTSISFGVSPHLERDFDTQFLEFRLRYIDVEDPRRVLNEERLMRFNFDCD